MKIIFTLVLLIHFTFSFSQWTRVQQLPSSDIFSLYHKDGILYAGGKNIIYLSNDNGQTWDSTTTVPRFFEVDNIIVYKNELYATCFSIGVVKSPDGGSTWQNISAGIAPFVSDFSEFKGDLYAATEGASVFKLDPVNFNNWQPFSNGLSSFSVNQTSMAGNSNTLIAGTLANGMYDYLPANSTTWEERFLLGQIRPTEGVYDIIAGHDSLFLAGSTGTFYISTDNGHNWNTFGNRLPSSFTTLVNAKQALLFSRVTVDNTVNTSFFYIKKDSLQNSAIPFSFVPDHFTYKLEILDDKLWDASSRGLFFMSLPDLPGISSAADSTPNTPLPAKYISFDVQVKADKTVSLRWKTGDETNIDHFEIERSADGINWNSLANVFPQLSREYSYTDLSPDEGINYYRVKEADIDGTFFYSTVKSVMLENETKFLIWPNPASEVLHARLPFAKGIFEMIDASGRILFSNVINSNNITIPMLQLRPGEYFLQIHNDKATLIERFIKQ